MENNLESFGIIENQLESFRNIENHLESIGIIEYHQESFGIIWNYWKSFRIHIIKKMTVNNRQKNPNLSVNLPSVTKERNI